MPNKKNSSVFVLHRNRSGCHKICPFGIGMPLLKRVLWTVFGKRPVQTLYTAILYWWYKLLNQAKGVHPLCLEIHAPQQLEGSWNMLISLISEMSYIWVLSKKGQEWCAGVGEILILVGTGVDIDVSHLQKTRSVFSQGSHHKELQKLVVLITKL